MVGPLVVGVAGGSGSGKTTLVERIRPRLQPAVVEVLPHDAYYRCNRHLSSRQRRQLNYDHPDSLETDLLIDHIHRLRRGLPIHRPVYDFATHLRQDETIRVEPSDVLVVEGILVLADEALRALMDLKVFVHAPAPIRLERRVRRDVQERGRNAETIRLQHQVRVRPMYDLFVEPSRTFADMEIDNETSLDAGVDALARRLRRLIQREVDP